MTMRLARRIFLAGAVAGCASPSPDLYTLAAVPGTPRPGMRSVVELRGIGLARYLERPQIVRSSDDFRLDVAANEWWGEPLDAMLARVILRNLTQRLPDATVFRESGAVSGVPDVVLGVDIPRLDWNRTGAAVLAAQISVSGRAGSVRSFATEAAAENGSTAGRVAAMSVAVGRLADRAAEMLAGGR